MDTVGEFPSGSRLAGTWARWSPWEGKSAVPGTPDQFANSIHCYLHPYTGNRGAPPCGAFGPMVRVVPVAARTGAGRARVGRADAETGPPHVANRGAESTLAPSGRSRLAPLLFRPIFPIRIRQPYPLLLMGQYDECHDVSPEEMPPSPRWGGVGVGGRRPRGVSVPPVGR